MLWCSSSNIAGLLAAIQRTQGDAYDLVLLTADNAFSNLTLLESYPNAVHGLIGLRSFDSSNTATVTYLNQNANAGVGEFDNPNTIPVVDAILAYLHALSDIHRAKCGGIPGMCQDMAALSTSEVLETLKRTSFSRLSGEDFTFDDNGEPSDFTLEIMQYQNDTNSAGSSNIMQQVNHVNNVMLNVVQVVFSHDF